MNTRITKTLVVTAMLGVAGATFALVSRFGDVPANHWASEAVNYVTEKGLMQGYPDNTYKGQRNLTRYEMAAILYRLVRSGVMQNADAATQEMVNKGLADLRAEIAQVKAQAAANGELAGRVTTLEGQIKTLAGAPAPAATNLAPLEKQIADLEAKLKALEARPVPAPAAVVPANLEARLAALDNAVKVNAAQDTKIAALEAQLGKLQDQNTRITALEGQVKTLGDDVRVLRERLTATTTTVTPPAPTTTPTVTPPTVTPPAPTTTSPTRPATSPAATPKFSVSLGGSSTVYPFPASFNINQAGVFGAVGVNNLIGPIGLRVLYDASVLPSAGAELVFSLGNGLFSPYLALGGGAMFAGANIQPYAGGALGANINFNNNFGLFVEGAPQYNFSVGSFGVKARIGLQLRF